MSESALSADKEFTLREEVFFVSYHDVIKMHYPFILQKINQSKALQRSVSELIHLDAFRLYESLQSLETFCFQRKELYLFDYLKKAEFDVHALEKQFLFRYNDMYHHSSLLAIGEAVHLWMKESFVKKIYIHTDEYDPRIHADLQLLYTDFDKVTYVTGPLCDTIDLLPHKPTGYFLANIDDIVELASDTKKYLDYTHIFIADYRYNYVQTEDSFDYRFDLGEYLGDSITRFSMFKPIEFTDEHFKGFEALLAEDDGVSLRLTQNE